MSKPVFQDVFKFSGRRNRKSFILFSLAMMGVQLLVVYLMILASRNSGPDDVAVMGLAFVLAVTILVSGFAQYTVMAQRLRDMNQPGALVFAIIGGSVALSMLPSSAAHYFVLGTYGYLSTAKGTVGPNKFGDDPLGDPTAAAPDDVAEVDQIESPADPA